MSSVIPYNTYSHNFGILIPEDTGVTFTHQSGGMSCKQIDLEGIFLPLKHPRMNVGYPEWMTNSDKDISDIDLTLDHIPEQDFNSFPEWVQERGHFYNWDEFHYWLNQDHVDWYDNLDLIKEQELWNYDPKGDMHEEVRDYNPSEKWDSLEQIWSEIDKCLPFKYEEFNVHEFKKEAMNSSGKNYSEIETPLPKGYPEYGSAFKWIKITDASVEWAKKLSGEYVIMTYTNCD